MKQHIKVSTLKNGSLLISEQVNYLNSSIFGVFVRIGSDYEPIQLNGISHMTEHMLFKGTKSRNAKQIALEIETLGGIFNAYTSRDHTAYYFISLPSTIKHIFDIFSDMLFNSTIPENELKKEKRVILEELYSSLDNPSDLVFQSLNSMIFKQTQYAKNILGNVKSIDSIKREHIIDFINKYYQNSNLFFSYVGPQRHCEIKDMLNFNNSRKGKIETKHLKRIKNNFSNSHYIYKPSIKQFHIGLGRKSYKYNSFKKYPLIILSTILGTGMSSRLFGLLREEKGLVYEINSFVEAFEDSGTFGIYFACDKKNYMKALEMIREEFKNIRKHCITKDELNKAKTQIIASNLINFDTMSGRMRRNTMSIMYYNEIKYLDDIIKTIKGITIDDVKQVIDEMLIYDKFNIAIVGNKKGNIWKK